MKWEVQHDRIAEKNGGQARAIYRRFSAEKATKVDELEAQVLYTALMTDTLIEEDKEDV